MSVCSKCAGNGFENPLESFNASRAAGRRSRFPASRGRAAPKATADRVVIRKSERKLDLYAGTKLLKSYAVSLGSQPVGPKSCEGDGKTPEGIYQIVGRNSKSAFHKSLRISYPREEDRVRADKLKCSPGGDIMIHGLPNGYGWVGAGHRAKDWTAGCITVTDAEIEEIWNAVADGTVVEIRA